VSGREGEKGKLEGENKFRGLVRRRVVCSAFFGLVIPEKASEGRTVFRKRRGSTAG